MKRLGPNALWTLDETSGSTAYDYSGNNLNGTYTGSVTAGGRRFGPFIAPDFAPSPFGYVSVADNSLLSPHAGANGRMSVVAHVLADTFGANQMIVTRGGVAYEFELMSQLSGAADAVTIISNGSSGDFASAGTGVLVLSRQSQMVMVYDKAASYLRLYIDGVKVAEQNTLNVTTADTASTLAIGRRDDSAGNPWDGAIAMVGIYPTAFGASQIATLYRAWTADRGFRAA